MCLTTAMKKNRYWLARI